MMQKWFPRNISEQGEYNLFKFVNRVGKHSFQIYTSLYDIQLFVTYLNLDCLLSVNNIPIHFCEVNTVYAIKFNVNNPCLWLGQGIYVK